MKRKICVLVIVILTLGTLLSACSKEPPAPPVYIESPNASYEVVDVRVEDTYNTQAAPEGQQYLLITVQGDKENMDDMEETFFGLGYEPSKVKTVTEEIDCSLAAYGTMKKNDPSILATYSFIVPLDFPASFTFQANNAEPVLLEFEAEDEGK